MSGEIKTEIERKRDIKSWFESEGFREQIAAALPSVCPPKQFLRVCMTTVFNNPALQRCTKETMIQSVMECAQLGLQPDGVLGNAYIIPYGQKAQFQLGYKGMLTLARRSGEIKTISAEAVFKNDKFSYALGLNPTLEHVPPLDGERGDMTHVYATAHFRDGGYQFVVMSRADVEKIRKSSKASGNGPWVTHYDAMARKTVIRQLFKFLPASVDVQRAFALDEIHDAGIASAVETEFKVAAPTTTLDDLAEKINAQTGEVTPAKPEVEMTDDDKERAYQMREELKARRAAEQAAKQ